VQCDDVLGSYAPNFDEDKSRGTGCVVRDLHGKLPHMVNVIEAFASSYRSKGRGDVGSTPSDVASASCRAIPCHAIGQNRFPSDQ
jgi:hypothetical protein